MDTALFTGCVVPPYYDSLVAKVIAHGSTRLEAIRRMRRALEEFIVDGFITNASLSHLMLYESDFVRGEYDTDFVAGHMEKLLQLSSACDRLSAEGERDRDAE